MVGIEITNTCISDHNILYVTTNFSCGFRVPTPDNLFVMQKCDWEVVGENLQAVDWALALNSSSVASCLSSFYEVLSVNLSYCTPMRTHSAKKLPERKVPERKKVLKA